MKKRIIAHVMILMMMFSMLGGTFLSAGASVGSVTHVREMTENSPAGTYYVAAEEDLSRLAELVNSGNTMQGYTFLQTADITLTAANFTPIGDFDSSKEFNGTYDGQRHTISNLQIYDKNRNGAGLFGNAKTATLKNIGIESGSVTSANRAGGIAGYADSCIVINCYNKANITILSGKDGVGGIAGVARGTAAIYGCYNAGTITCTTNGGGGIVGWGGQAEHAMLIGCYSAGKLAHSGTLESNRPLDVISRTGRTIGDFSSCYYLAGIYSAADTYNLHNAQKLTVADNLKMAYVLNHATGANTNAFTVDKSGAIVFSADETAGVIDLRVKAMRGGVLLEDTDIKRVAASGYTVPATYASYEVLGATVGETAYKAGDFIPADPVDVLTVTLNLAGSYPSVADYAENPSATAFTVSSAKELAKLAELVDAGNDFAGKTVYVTADLDFSEYSDWNGIGHATGSGGGVVGEGSLPFSGTFDGQFHHFKNINFKSNARYTAIFSHTEGATLKNIIFDEGTVHVSSDSGRNAGVVVGLMSNTTVMNMENHVSVYADQVNNNADNLGFVAMSTNNSVIKNVVSYGEIGLEDKTAIPQENGGLIGWGYRMSVVDNCIVVGEVYGSTYDPIARGTTITNSYYLPHHERTGTMTYDALRSGEAAWKLNKTAGANLWSKGENGPTLDPDFPAFPVHYMMQDADNLLSGSVTEYHNAGESVTLPAQPGFTLLNESKKYWPLHENYTMPCFEQTFSAWYSHKAYDITYVTNGGTFTAEPTVSAISGLAQPLPDAEMLVRNGYFFTGWYDNEQLTGEPITTTPVDLYHDVTYYAGWVEVEKISTATQLMAMDLDGHYILAADIDLSGVDFTPIGSYDAPFTGSFDGDGHTVSGLEIQSAEDYQGLFGVNAGLIRNLILAEDCRVTGNSYVGGIAGENLGTIENCISRATVSSIATSKAASFNLLVQNMRVASPVPQVRLNAMKKRMDDYDPDLMLLQEANTYWISFLTTNYVNTGEYKMLYKYRAASSKEAVPVLYKPEKFNLIDSGDFWLSATPDKESRPQGATHYRICTWAMLEEKATGRYLAVFSVHFDVGGDEVRAINSQALKDRMDAIREQYKAHDPMVIVAGDFNCRKESVPYEILETGDMVDAVYEITTGVAKSKIDHVLISENNLKAVDESFEYLPVEDVAQEIPSDHEGIYLELEGLENNRHGVICGSNSGAVRYSVAEGSVSAGSDHGALIGRNLGTAEALYYAEGDVTPFGLTVESNEATAMTDPVSTVYALKEKAVLDRFTIKGEKICLIHNGEEPVCLTEAGVNETHRYGETETVAPTCTEVGYTAKTCELCGYQHRIAEVAANGHQYGKFAPGDGLYHQKVCGDCGDIEYAKHSYTKANVVASCGVYGATRYTCSCGQGYDVVDDDPKSHIWSGCIQTDEATHLLTCARAEGHTLQKAHTFTVSTVDAACGVQGYTRHLCKACGYSYDKDFVEALSHSYVYDAETESYICGNCSGVYAFTGDLNGDGLADTADAILLLRRISGWKGELPDHAADVNCDGKIKVYDAVLYLQKLVG